MIFEYASLKGTLDGMDTSAITEIADYFVKEIGYKLPPMTPFVGEAFNATRAGIHADGLLKDSEIYNIFDTEKILNRPPTVMITNTSGLAGIAYWLNVHYHKLGTEHEIKKNSPLVAKIKEWVDNEFENGRHNVISALELEELYDRYYGLND